MAPARTVTAGKQSGATAQARRRSQQVELPRMVTAGAGGGHPEDVDDLTDRPAADPVAEAVAHLTPSVVPAWRLAQAQLLRERLAEVKQEFGLLTSGAVADLAGGSMKNPSSLATRWARQGRIIAIRTGSGNLYPGFQFDLVTGVPYPVMADLVAVWGRDDPVGLTVWCIAPNEWLSGERPVDLFTASPDRVRDAIARAVEL